MQAGKNEEHKRGNDGGAQKSDEENHLQRVVMDHVRLVTGQKALGTMRVSVRGLRSFSPERCNFRACLSCAARFYRGRPKRGPRGGRESSPQPATAPALLSTTASR